MTTDLVEKCARALWQRESERAALCDDALSSVRGQAIKPTMDPFDAHREMWIGDALAVIDALADGVTDAMIDAGNQASAACDQGCRERSRVGIAAAIRAAKTETREG